MSGSRRPLRIAAFHAFLDKPRGAEFAFASMVRGLKARGVDVHVFTLAASDEFVREFSADGIPCTTFGRRDVQSTKAFYYARLLQLDGPYYNAALRPVSEAMNALQPDSHLVHHSFLAPRLMGRLRGRKVFYCQEVPRVAYEAALGRRLREARKDRIRSRRPPRRWLQWALYPPRTALLEILRWGERQEFGRFAPLADVILVNSRHSKAQLMAHAGLDSSVCYLGVDAERFRPGKLPRARYVLSVGPLWPPIKGHEFVIRSLGRLAPHERPSLRLVGAGRPEDDARIAALAAEHGVELTHARVSSSTGIVEAYQEAGAVLVAYENEPFGLVAAEALACEAPVVAVADGGLKEIVAPGTGWLTPRDENTFAEAVRSALKDPTEASLRASRGRSHVLATFSWEACAATLERHLAPR